MLHLLKLEWLKLKNWNLFQLMIGFYIVLLPLFFLSGKGSDPVQSLGGNSFYSFPKIWAGLGYTGSWLTFFFFGFLGIVILSNEFGNKTFRQNVITGIKRTQLMWAKVYTIFAVSLFATLYYVLVGLVIGLIHTSSPSMSMILEKAHYIPRYFLQCIGWMVFAMFLGVLIRRTNLALFLYFIYTFFIELCLRWFVHRNIVSGESMHYYPMNTFEDLVWPFAEAFTENGTPMNIDFNLTMDPWKAVVGSIIYIILFLYLSFYFIKKRDL